MWGVCRVGGTGLLITDGPGVDFLVQEIPRKRSREFLSSIPKQALEAVRRQLGIIAARSAPDGRASLLTACSEAEFL